MNDPCVRLTKLHRLTERDSRLAHCVCTILESVATLGYLANSGAKYSCSVTPISYKGDEISRISRLHGYRDLHFGLFGISFCGGELGI